MCCVSLPKGQCESRGDSVTSSAPISPLALSWQTFASVLDTNMVSWAYVQTSSTEIRGDFLNRDQGEMVGYICWKTGEEQDAQETKES